MIRRPPRSTQSRSSAASDVYKRQRPAEIIQQNFFLCANHFVQVAGVVALTQAGPDVERMRAIYDERRRYLVPALREIGLRVEVEPTAAFYVFADASEWGS